MPIKRGSSAETERTPSQQDEEMALSFDSPESSLIERATYDPGPRVARVWLKGDRKHTLGKTYDYTLPEHVWRDWLTAESKGVFFSTRIRPLYAGRLVS